MPLHNPNKTDQQSQEARLMAKLERLTQAGSSEMGFVAEELQHLYERELAGVDLTKASPEQRDRTIKILKKIGDVNKMVGRFENAMKFYKQVLNADPDSVISAEIHRTLGMKERDATNWTKANEHYSRSLQICATKNDVIGLADSHRGLGYILWRRGDFENALKQYSIAIEILKNAQSKPGLSETAEEKLAILCTEEGNLLGELGNYEEALDSFDEAMSVLTRTDNKWEIARLHNNIGHIYVNMGRIDDALKEFESCVKLGQRLKEPRWLGWGNFNLAEIYGRKGDAAKAMTHVEEAKKHLTKIDDRVGLAKTHYTMGFALIAAGDIPAAKKDFEEAIKMCEKAQMPSLVAYYSYQYGLALGRLGDKAGAIRVIRKALQLYRSLNAEGHVIRLQAELDRLGKS